MKIVFANDNDAEEFFRERVWPLKAAAGAMAGHSLGGLVEKLADELAIAYFAHHHVKLKSGAAATAGGAIVHYGYEEMGDNFAPICGASPSERAEPMFDAITCEACKLWIESAVEAKACGKGVARQDPSPTNKVADGASGNARGSGPSLPLIPGSGLSPSGPPNAHQGSAVGSTPTPKSVSKPARARKSQDGT